MMECPKCGNKLSYDEIGYGFSGLVDFWCNPCGAITLQLPLDDCIDKIDPELVRYIKQGYQMKSTVLGSDGDRKGK